MTPDQQATLVTAILGADLAVAAILFGVLGFLYSVFATFARRELPGTEPVNETKLDLRPHPILWYLRRVALWLVVGLGISLLIATGCFAWFLFPTGWLCVSLAAGLLFEITFLFVIGCYVVFWLMPVYSRPG